MGTEYNKVRAKWREEVSTLRRKYADEYASQQRVEAEKRAEKARQERLAKMERMREKLKRSARNRELIQIREQEIAKAQETNKKVGAKLRAEREEQRKARAHKLVEHLCFESQHWLQPEKLDEQITESMFDQPCLVGHFDERSPYWGYFADVEDPFSMEPKEPSIPPPDQRTDEDALKVVTNVMLSYAKNY